jgi:hypothetical protein
LIDDIIRYLLRDGYFKESGAGKYTCEIVVYLTSSCVNWAFFGPRVPKKAQFTQERVEYNVFLFDEPLKGSKPLKFRPSFNRQLRENKHCVASRDTGRR